MPLSEQERKKLIEFFECRKPTKSLPMLMSGGKSLSTHIFELLRCGDCYQLSPTNFVTASTMYPLLQGSFAFVVLATDPGRIYCGKYWTEVPDDGVSGHPYVAEFQDVLMAGDMKFDNARLLKWTNGSGHYKPKSSAWLTLHPIVQRMLPQAQFENKDSWWR